MSANLLAGDRDGTRDCLPAVAYQPVDRLTLGPGNPRKRSKKQIRQIARSIKEFGLVDADLKVIAGHGRLLAARQARIAAGSTIALEHLTPEQAKAFAIADNRLSELSRWNIPVLREALSELSTLELDFSLDIPGSRSPRSSC